MVERLCFDPAIQRDPRLHAAGMDFIEQNAKPRLLKADDLDLGRKVEIISSTEIHTMFSKGILPGWEKFYRSHPDAHGYVELSAVGFTADKNFAVVYSAVHCGPNCGVGGFVTFSKKAGIWRKNTDRLCS